MLPATNMQWPICWPAVELIARAESCRLVAYRCPAGVWTCGWGETDGVAARTRWSQPYADQRFCDSLQERADAVLALCTRPPNENELGAMVSLAYNIGIGAFAKSSVLRAHNRGDSQAAARAFGLWNKARVRGVLAVLAGLTARRAAEAALYLMPVDDSAERMPQAVEPESRLPASPIASSGAITAGTGVLVAVAQVQDQVAPVAGAIDAVKGLFADALGIPPGLALAAALVALGGVVLYQRWRQRSEGWA
jgi:lysozyme